MKKYFTKFLPVDGEIKEGDYVLTSEGDVITWIDIGNETPSDKKVKLFLCSRDIQVGDKFDSANGTGFICSKKDEHKLYSIGGLHSDIEEVPHSLIYCYKVIGEISPDAIWVTEGMEFDEEDIENIYILPVHAQFKGFTHEFFVDFVEIPSEEYIEEWADNYFKTEGMGAYRVDWDLKNIKLKHINFKCPTCQKFH